MEKQTADQQASQEKRRRPVVLSETQEQEESVEQLQYNTSLYKTPSIQAQAETIGSLPTTAQRQDAVSHIGRVQGNRHVQRLVGAVRARRASTPALQPKLTVGEPDDLYEEEADRTAEAVMRMSASAPAAPPSSEEEDLHSVSVGVQASSVGTPGMTPELEDEVNGLRGTGRPLPASERDFFEGRMQADFGAVRVHTGETAAHTTEHLQAKAYTVGSDIVFGEGQYQPGTEAGRTLLAHELTHVVQQGAAGKLRSKRVEALQRAAVIQAPVPQIKEEEEEGDGPVGPPPPQVVAEQKAQAGTPEAEPTAGEVQSAQPEVAGMEEPLPAVAPASRIGDVGAATPPTPGPKRDPLKGDGAAPPAQAGAQAVAEVAGELPPGPAGVEVETTKDEAPSLKGQDVESAAGAGGEKGAGESAAPGEPKAAVGPEEGATPAEEQVAAEPEGAVAPAVDTAEEAAAPEQAPPELQEQGAELQAQKDQSEQSAQQADSQAQEAVSALESQAGMQVRFAPSAQAEGDQAQVASEGINEFINRNTQRVTSVLASTQDVQPRFTAISEQTKTQIQGAVQVNLQNLRGMIAAARQQVLTKATQAEGEITGLYDTTAAEIEQSALQALEKVDSEYQAKVQGLNVLESSTSQDIDDRFAKAQTDLREAGRAAGVDAEGAKGEALNPVIAPYQGREGDFWEGKNYYKKKITAAEDAADGVIQGYKDEFAEQAEATAQQLPQGKQDVLATAQQKLQAARTAIDAEHARANQAIEDSRLQSLEAARQTQEQNLTALRQSKAETLAALTELQGNLEAQLQSTGAQQMLVIEEAAQAAIADVRTGSAEVAAQLHEALQTLGAQLQGAPAPDPEALSEMLAGSQAQFDGVMSQLQGQLSARRAAAEQALRTGGQKATGAVGQVAQTGSNLITPVVQDFVTGADDMVQRATTALNETRNQHVEATGKESEGAVQSMAEAYIQAEQDVQDVSAALDQGLGKFVSDFKSGPEGLDKSLGQLKTDIRTKAQEAADKVLPRWKSVVAFVGKLLVAIVVAIAIAAVVAVALASGGWVALLLGALAAGAIGAIGGVAKGMIDNAVQGKALFTKDLWVEAGIGAIEGVLAFAGGAVVGKLVSAAKFGNAWKFLGETAVDLVKDTVATVSNMLIKGDFTWVGLGLSMAESLVFSLVGGYVGKKVAGRRPKADVTPSASQVDVTPGARPDLTPGASQVDVTPGARPDLAPGASQVDVTPSMRAAQERGLPELPEGYVWVKTGKKAIPGSSGSAADAASGAPGMYIRRVAGQGPAGADAPQLKMDWEQGRVVDVQSGKVLEAPAPAPVPSVPSPPPRGGLAETGSSEASTRSLRERVTEDGLPAGKKSVMEGWKEKTVGKATEDVGKKHATLAEDAWLPGGSSDKRRQEAGLENQAEDLAEAGVEEGQSWEWAEDWEEYQKQKQP